MKNIILGSSIGFLSLIPILLWLVGAHYFRDLFFPITYICWFSMGVVIGIRYFQLRFVHRLIIVILTSCLVLGIGLIGFISGTLVLPVLALVLSSAILLLGLLPLD